MSSIHSNVLFLCELTSQGLTGAELVAAVNSTHPKNFMCPCAQEVRLGCRDPFPISPAGTKIRLGVVFGESLGDECAGEPSNKEVDEGLLRLGVLKPPADAADYLRLAMSQGELVRQVNSARPSGVRGIHHIVVPHAPLRSPDGIERVSLLHAQTVNFVPSYSHPSLLSSGNGRWHDRWSRMHAYLALLP